MKRHQDKDDSALVEGCIRKDPVSWSMMAKKYSALISASIYNRLKKYGFDLPREDLEDIGQDFLKSLWKGEKLNTVRNRKDISFWLAISAGNEAVEYIRRTRMNELPVTPLYENIGEKLLEDTAPSGRPCPSEELAQKEFAGRAETEINALPAKEKLVIKLNILYGKKYDEIAAMLNMPAGTVSSYIKRAKEKLKLALKDFK